MLLIDAENDRLGETVGSFEMVGEMPGDRSVRARQGHHSLEIDGVVFFVRDGTAETVDVTLTGPPAGSVPGGDYAMDAIRRQKPIVNALPQTVGVDRYSEIVGMCRHCLRAGRGGQSQLVGRFEILQNFAPIAFVVRAASMAFVHENEVKEAGIILAIKTRAAFIAGDGLVNGEIHLAALLGNSILDFPAGVTERREGLIHRIVDQDVSVGKV